MLQELIDVGVEAVLQKKKKVYAQHVNRISSMGEKCERKLFYRRTAWDKAAEVSTGLQGIFETGNILEPESERIFTLIGKETEPKMRIVGQQSTTKDRLLDDYKISGTIDGFLQTKTGEENWKTVGVVDMKSCSPNVFSQISTKESLYKYWWTEKYIAQIMLYALAHNLENCFLLFYNKQNIYEMKMVEFPLDYDYAESLLQKADRVNKAVESKTPPPKINKPDECTRCEFASYCLPEIQHGDGIKTLSDSETADMLDRFAELKPYKQEYDSIDKKLKDSLIKGQDAICGNYLVTWKEISGTRQPTDGGAFSYWKRKIESLS